MTVYKQGSTAADLFAESELGPTDSVTGLPSHTVFQRSMARELKRFERDGNPFTLALVDIDRFGAYNKKHGYAAGDRLLAKTGELICGHIRRHDLVARYGQDTFALLFCGSDPAAACRGMERISEAVLAFFNGEVSLSAGLAGCPADAVERESLLLRATGALQEAKNHGGNRVFFFQQSLPSAVASRGRILVVDDSSRNLKLMKAMLTPQGYEIVTADGGAEALRAVLQSEIDLVLLDVMMPEMDGFEVCRRLKGSEATRLIPVVLVTALDDDASILKGIEAGADDFITKPPDKNKLFARSRSLIRMRRSNRKLANVENVLFSLAKAIEAKDPYTEGHVERVASLATALGRRLGLPEQEIEALRIGGILHDIGKIGISNRILNKPGPLDDGEWRVMRTHPDIGYKICLPLSQTLGTSLEVIRHHHEKLDGSGYPDGLKANNVPLVARIMAVVDIYDALVSDRPYRKGMAQKAAFSILGKEAASGKLDETVVQSLMALLQPRTPPRRASIPTGSLAGGSHHHT